jgi:O-antigen/teichoic acid export membrane protein
MLKAILSTPLNTRIARSSPRFSKDALRPCPLRTVLDSLSTDFRGHIALSILRGAEYHPAMTVARHTLYNIAGATAPIAVSLLTVPAYLSAVGDERFGILAIVWLFLGYFGLFDFGLGLATSHHIAAAEHHADPGKERARLFWVALLINLALGTLGGLLLLPAGHYYFAHVIEVDAALRREMLAAVPWLAVGVPVATLTWVLTGGLQGLRQFGPLNAISAAGTVLFQVMPLLAALFWSPSLTIVVPVALLARAITLLVLADFVRRKLVRGHPPIFSGKGALKLLKFGSWVTLSALFAPLLAIIDRFAIGAEIGAAAVAIYAIPLNLAERLAIVGNSTAFAAIPEFSSATLENARLRSVRYERVVMAIMLGLCVTGIFVIGPFLQIWISPNFAGKATLVAQVLLIGIWADSVSRITLYANRGTGRNRAIAILDILQIPVVIAAIYLGLNFFGVLGVACAYAFRVFLNYFLLIGLLKTTLRVTAPILASVGVLIFSLALSSNLAAWTPAWLASIASCWILTAGVVLLIVPRDLLLSFLQRMQSIGAKQ